MQPREICAGLWRWSTAHPEWQAGAARESPADWPREVGCTLYETPDAAVFIDPLIPAGNERFWRWSDRHSAARAVHVLSTIRFHRRSRDELVARYGASTSRAKRRLPRGVQSIALRGAGETLFWLPEPRTLVAGDRLIGTGGGLALCPESWLRYLPGHLTVAALRELLLPLLELPVERVLVSHGEPVLSGGHEALARALDRPQTPTA